MGAHDERISALALCFSVTMLNDTEHDDRLLRTNTSREIIYIYSNSTTYMQTNS